MSDLTDEIAAVIAELADELGEGLAVTLVVTPRTVDRSTGSVTDGTPIQYDVDCPPPSPWIIRGADGSEVRSDSLRLVIPSIVDGSGAVIEPSRGDKVRLRSVDHQIVAVYPISAGDGVSGYVLEIRR